MDNYALVRKWNDLLNEIQTRELVDLLNEYNRNQVIAKAKEWGGPEDRYVPRAERADDNYLAHNFRTRQEIEDNSIKLIEIIPGHMIFNIEAFSRKDLNNYKIIIQFVNWKEIISDPNLTAEQKVSEFVKNVKNQTDDVKMHCECPSWRYHYNYVADQKYDAALNPETRAPNITNPGQKGIVCKHIRRIVHVFPAYRDNLLAFIKKMAGAKE